VKRRSWSATLGQWFLPPEFYREYRPGPATWVEAVFEPAVLVAAVVSFSTGLVQFGLALVPTWPADGLVPLAGLAALASFLYARRLARGAILWKEWLVILVPFLLAVRLLPYLAHPEALAGDLWRWWSDPLSFFDLAFIVGTLLVAGAWWTGFRTTLDLNSLRVQAGEILSERLQRDPLWETDRGRFVDHTTPLRNVAGRFLAGGVVLLVLSGLTALDVRQLLSLQAVVALLTVGRPAVSGALVNVVLYFVLVLLLLAEMQYVRQRTLWQVAQVPVAPTVPGHWVLSSLGLVAVALVGALLLPTEHMLPLAVLLDSLIQALRVVAFWLFFALYLVLWVLTLPFRLLSPGAADAGLAPGRFQPPAAPPPGSAPGWLDLVRSLVFWGIALLVVLYAGRTLLSQRPGRVVWAQLARAGRALGRLWGWLWRRAGAARQRAGLLAGLLLARVLSAAAPVRPRAGRFRWLRRLAPRDLIIALYLATVERAGRLGVARRPSQTPLEYQAALRQRFPDLEPDLSALTAAFLEARYSPRPIGPDEVATARRAWAALRQRLHRWRRRGRAPGLSDDGGPLDTASGRAV